jgi:hypothetical protein
MNSHVQSKNASKDALHECLRLHEKGELSVDQLRRAIDQPNQRQDILYIQTLFSSVTSPVNGMSLIENGQVQAMPDDPEDWPYQSVLEAINDGWRVISFPNLALMMDSSKTYGMGCEFILEKLTGRAP